MSRPSASTGLQVDGLFDRPLRLEAREAIDLPLDDTLLVVTVKAVDLEASLRRLARFLRPTTAVLLLQNGLGIRELALEALRDTPALPENVFIGIVAMGATFIAPGEVRCFGGNIRVEPAFAATPWFALLGGLKLKVEASRDIRRDLWTKLLVNSVINPLSVLLQGAQPPGRRGALRRAQGTAPGRRARRGRGRGRTRSGSTPPSSTASSPRTTSPPCSRTSAAAVPPRSTSSTAPSLPVGKKHGIPTPVNGYVVPVIKALESRRLRDA